MKHLFTLLIMLLNCFFALGQRNNFGQKNTYREAVSLYKQDRHLFAGTVYGIYQVPVGPYRKTIQNRGWGLGIENRITMFRGKSAFKPVYSINTTINRWNQEGSLGTDIVLSGQAGLNYFFPNASESLKTYVQGLLGVGAAGSYLTQDRGFSEEINHQGIGPVGSLGTGIYLNRLHLGLACNFFSATMKNQLAVTKNMSSVYIRVGARL